MVLRLLLTFAACFVGVAAACAQSASQDKSFTSAENAFVSVCIASVLNYGSFEASLQNTGLNWVHLPHKLPPYADGGQSWGVTDWEGHGRLFAAINSQKFQGYSERVVDCALGASVDELDPKKLLEALHGRTILNPVDGEDLYVVDGPDGARLQYWSAVSTDRKNVMVHAIKYPREIVRDWKVE